MKKCTAILLTILLLASSFLMLTASAWETPKLMLAADYNAEKKTITVQYRLLDFAGTESADFWLKYNSNAVEYVSHEETEIDDVMLVVEKVSDGSIAIQFVDLYHVKKEDCEADGSATIATFTFKVTDDSAEKAVFIATADSCNMDPDSAEVTLRRATLNLPLTNGSTFLSTEEGYSFAAGESQNDENSAKIRKVIIAAVVVGIVFVIGLVAVVIKYRKSDPEN